jgi:hypothetical protein
MKNSSFYYLLVIGVYAWAVLTKADWINWLTFSIILLLFAIWGELR